MWVAVRRLHTARPIAVAVMATAVVAAAFVALYSGNLMALFG